MKKIEGRTALITGCNRGIGRAIMETFVAEGANIIACTRTITDELTQYYTKLENENKINITPLCIDLSNEESINVGIKSLIQNKISIDILVNNAGTPDNALLLMTSMHRIKEVFQINFFGLVQITQLVAKQMIRRKSGVIINIGSMAGLENFSGYTAYGSSKAAVMYFTRILARELGAFNVRVNAVAPGLLEDGMGKLQNDKSSEEILSRTDLKRKGSAQDIANMVLFLSSDDTSYITGQVYRVDGGM